jgi:hypothetical protein
MALSLITMVQRLAPRVNLRAPTIALLSQDLNVQILTAFFQEEGDELMRFHDWNALIVEYTVPALGAVAQTAFPSDFDRFVEKAEIWNRTLNGVYFGPTDERQWQWMQSGLISAGYIGWWRLIGGVLQITPAPTAGDTLAFNYISNKWARSAGGTAQTSFLLDTDEPRIPDHLFIPGARWRYRASRGFDYAEDMSTYERLKEKAAANDRGLTIIRKSSGRSEIATPTWPGTIG